MKKLLALVIVMVMALGTQVAPAGAADSAVLQGSATRLYTAYFKRAPDLGGLRYWVGKLQAGFPLRSASSLFASSSEFQHTYGSLSNAAFVDLVYQNVLGRSADAAGKAYWSGLLLSGRANRGGVMVGFSESNEFVRKTGTTPPRPSASFGDGTRKVAAITWRNTSNAAGCYWERLKGFSGNLDDIIANDFAIGNWRSIVTVDAADAGFSSKDCGTWVPDIGPLTLAPSIPFGEGMFRVGRDVAPGTWRIANPSDGCYWERLSGFSGQSKDILANDFDPGPTMVTIGASDIGFSSQGCGTWTKVG